MNREKVLPRSHRQIEQVRAWITRIDWKLVLLLGLPLFLIAFNTSWLFSYVLENWIDPWVYFGYFLDLKQHLNTFEGAYYGTRLPWILPGFLAYKFFSPLTAAYALHLAFYYAAVISLYLILKRTIGQRTALITALLMGCYYYFLSAIGKDYVDGAGLTYMLLTLLMMTNKDGVECSHRRLSLAGLFYGCMIFTQLFLITYTPLIAAYLLFLNQKYYHLPIKSFLHPFGFGFIGLTLFLCCINYLLNGSFFFFYPILKFTAGFVLHLNPWWSSISHWWMKAEWLLLPAVTFLGSCLTLVFYRSLENRKLILFLQVYFILNVLMYIVIELVARQPVLNLLYYSSYMLPAMFLALGSQLSVVVNQLSRNRFYLLFVSVAAVSLFAYIYPVDLRWIDQPYFYITCGVILFGIAGVTAIAVQQRHFKEIGVLFIGFSFAIVNLGKLACKYDSAFQKNSFLGVVKGVRAVQDMDPKGNSRFWYDCHHLFGSMHRAVSSAYLWGYRVFNEDFPGLTSPYLSYQLVLNDRIFILSDDENAMEKANQSLAQSGFKGEFIDKKVVNEGSV